MKRCADLVTGSKTTMFKSARFKLTAWYLAIIMAVSLMFSLVIYRAVSMEVKRFEERQRFGMQRILVQHSLPLPPPPRESSLKLLFEKNPELMRELRNRFLILLGVVNVAIFISAGGLGYWLAGVTLKPIQQMVEEQTRFVSDASHELKTPLTSLKAAFEVYLRNPKRTLKEAEVIMSESVAEVDKLQKLSESMLELAHFQKPGVVVNFKLVNLTETIRAAIRKMSASAKIKKLTLKFKGAVLQAKGDRESLEQLVVILLDNAIKFSPKRKTVTLTLTKVDKKAQIEVKDEGPGVAEKDLPHIFERFYRADAARSQTRENGYGLGLAIAQEIVKKHRGTLLVESQPGEGSIFKIFLPLFS